MSCPWWGENNYKSVESRRTIYLIVTVNDLENIIETFKMIVWAEISMGLRK